MDQSRSSPGGENSQQQQQQRLHHETSSNETSTETTTTTTTTTTMVEEKLIHTCPPPPSQIVHVQVDVIIPVHNSSKTIKAAVESAMKQEEIPSPNLLLNINNNANKYKISIAVCCYDDGSTDDSWQILQQLVSSQKEYSHEDDNNNNKDNSVKIPTKLLIGQGKPGIGRGAGFARNRAIELNNNKSRATNSNKDGNDDQQQHHAYHHHFLCLLDSDDIMHKHRVALQTQYMLTKLTPKERSKCILGCTFDRDPPDSTWHYASWANSLDDRRLVLEKFRELTVIHPTWFLCRSRWESLGGYIEAPMTDRDNDNNNKSHNCLDTSGEEEPTAPTETTENLKLSRANNANDTNNRLIHPIYDNNESLKLAEDLRFFHEHLESNGILRLYRSSTITTPPLVTYRHAPGGTTQSYRTSRKLLLQLRVLAFERSILQPNNKNWWWYCGSSSTNNSKDCQNQIQQQQQQQQRFIIWGAGRDGKDFVKALPEENRSKVYCFVDVDTKKLDVGRYTNRDIDLDVPIIHFSFLIKDQTVRQRMQKEYEEGSIASNDNSAIIHGRIDKTNPNKAKVEKKQQTKDAAKSNDDDKPPNSKKQKRSSSSSCSSKLDIRGLSQQTLQELPVVVCVAMYRTNGVLEKNVQTIGRTEGCNLWHFS